MAIDPQDEILHDFLIEAGELLDGLNEQLVALERTPNDRDLLNAVFRSFHTIKGGAGFLNLHALVQVCHLAEDVFNLLRNNQRKIDPFLMDTILRALDVVNTMFGDLKAGREPQAASDKLLKDLAALAVQTPVAQPTVTASTTTSTAVPTAKIFNNSKQATSSTANNNNDISQADFEALLNALPPEGDDTKNQNASSATNSGANPKNVSQPVSTPTASNPSNSISEEEFESLLDQLQVKKPTESSELLQIKSTTTHAVTNEVEHEDPSKNQRNVLPTGETSVRVDTQRLDEIMNLVGELVLVRNRMSMLRARTNDEELGKAIGALALVTADLQTAVMKTRMQPIKKVFSRFPRVVRDLARSLGKEIELITFGEETDLDKNLVEALADPLVHLIRNAVDHGIETPKIREAKGKPRQGKIILGAAQEGDHISLVIEDDGKGMDPEVLRKKAVEKGLFEPVMAERLSERDCFNLIFLAGFSTKDEISDVSGRGVGMDVVKTRIAQLNGTVEIESQLGKGSKLHLKLPLTLAILPALMVILNGRRFAIPLASVSEILDLDLTKSHFVDDQEVILVRKRALPLFYVGRWLDPERLSQPHPSSHVVVVQVAQNRVGLVVDGLVGQEEVVIKPLGRNLQGIPGLAGATITGDGGIALIIDVPALLRVLKKPGLSGRASRIPDHLMMTGVNA